MCTGFYIILRPSCLHAGDIGKPNQTFFDIFWTRAHTYTFSSVLFAASSPRSSFLKILRIGRICAGFMQDVMSLLLTGSCLSSCLRKSFSACFITKSCKSQKETYSEPVSVWNVHHARVTTQSQLLRITRCFQVSNKQVWQFAELHGLVLLELSLLKLLVSPQPLHSTWSAGDTEQPRNRVYCYRNISRELPIKTIRS